MPGARVVRSLDMGPPSRLPCRRYEMSEPTGDEVRVIQWGWAPGPTFATGPQGWAASFSGSFVERAVITQGATTLGHYTERGASWTRGRRARRATRPRRSRRTGADQHDPAGRGSDRHPSPRVQTVAKPPRVGAPSLGRRRTCGALTTAGTAGRPPIWARSSRYADERGVSAANERALIV